MYAYYHYDIIMTIFIANKIVLFFLILMCIVKSFVHYIFCTRSKFCQSLIIRDQSSAQN